MTQEDYQLFENMYLAKINKVDTRFVRYLYKTINWDVRLIGIKGARGVGKTTLLLQRIKMAYKKGLRYSQVKTASSSRTILYRII